MEGYKFVFIVCQWFHGRMHSRLSTQYFRGLPGLLQIKTLNKISPKPATVSATNRTPSSTFQADFFFFFCGTNVNHHQNMLNGCR